MDSISLILKALEFAAGRHLTQHRKGADRAPYINHPIQVASLLVNEAGEEDPVLIAAAILHDVIEDTVDSEEEKKELINRLREIFGEEVLSLTLEVTDDESLEKKERKRLQVVFAPSLSGRAQKLRIADKIMNLHDIYSNPPEDWPLQRIIEYYDWAENVVAGIRGVNTTLDEIFDETLKAGREKYHH
ncbi:MAG: HD domain-containing protein [Bacteroidales bacterium]|nr:HD domain-containing protein [Bacteroidales bacterium]